MDGLCDHLRDILCEDICKLSASVAASEFCECVQIGVDVYIPRRKYPLSVPSTYSDLLGIQEYRKLKAELKSIESSGNRGGYFFKNI